MVKRMRLVMRQGLLDYATVKDVKQPKPMRPEQLSLLSKLWRNVV
jgi:hypothetical protein